MKSNGIARITCLILIVALAFCGCSAPKKADNTSLPEGAAANDILTFEPNQQNKPIVRIGMQYYTPDTHLSDALSANFPDYNFVLDYRAASGSGAETVLVNLLENGLPLDMVISGRAYFLDSDVKYYLDLSAEPFLDNYLLSALNGVSIDGHIFFLPGVSVATGIAYNVDMFEANGWRVPKDIEEYFALCETIRKTGVAPMSNCLKYASQINTMYGTMCYDQLYASPADVAWLNDVQSGKATFKGHMEPFFELAKRFYDTGVSNIGEFTASLTKQRQAFWAGEYAMMFYSSAIFNYAVSEKAPFEVGMMPFPAKNAERTGFSVTPAYYMALPKALEKNPERLKLMKDVLAFLSTPEGQTAMLTESLNVSNVRGVDFSGNPAFKYMKESYEKGNLYPLVSYDNVDFSVIDLQQASVKAIFEGASVEEAIDLMDDSMKLALSDSTPKTTYETIAKVEKDFTMLETSYYIADKLREATGADIALMLNGGYFRSNLATLFKGDKTSDMRIFVMKGVAAQDCLTTYLMTGAQIKQMLERPIINGAEEDAFVAASGLSVAYAPWRPRGSRVLSVTLTNGGALTDDSTYKVAAWNGVIDEKYITDTVKTHEELGALTDLIEHAMRRDGSISPSIEGRVTLDWSVVGP